MNLYNVHGRSIRKQLLLYTLLTLAVYLVSALTIRLKGADESVIFISMFSLILSFMAYVGPVVFSGRDDTMLAQLPVTPGEKTVFYIGYCIVALVLFTQGLWYFFSWAGGFIFGIGNIQEVMESVVTDSSGGFMLKPELRVFSLAFNWLQTAMLILFSIYIVFTRRSHVMLKCILVPVAYLLCVGFISGVIGVIVGISHGVMEVSEGDHEAGIHIAESIITGMKPFIIAMALLTLLVCVYMSFIIYRKFKHPRIAH